jgi:hypothetical protein
LERLNPLFIYLRGRKKNLLTINCNKHNLEKKQNNKTKLKLIGQRSSPKPC